MHFFTAAAPKNRVWRLYAVRAALFSVVLNAWAPTVTALLAAAEGRPMAMPAHCLAMSLQSGGQDSSPPGTPAKDKGASCPFCFAHAGSVGLAPVIQAPQIASLAAGSVELARIEPLPASLIWLNAKPRGPPVFS